MRFFFIRPSLRGGTTKQSSRNEALDIVSPIPLLSEAGFLWLYGCHHLYLCNTFGRAFSQNKVAEMYKLNSFYANFLESALITLILYILLLCTVVPLTASRTETNLPPHIFPSLQYSPSQVSHRAPLRY